MSAIRPDQRGAVVDKIVEIVLSKHVDPSDINRDYAPWKNQVTARRNSLIAGSDDKFEAGIQELLAALGTSHMGFTRAGNPGASAIFSLNASLGLVGPDGEQQWMFQQVIEDGPAASAGIRPGEILLDVDGKSVRPSLAPSFSLGEPHQLVLENWRTKERRRVRIELPQASKEKGRPPMVIPKLITSRMLTGRVGYIRGSYFQGVLGQNFIRGFEAAVDGLHGAGAKAYVLDFRANPGGGLASLRMMSWLTPARVPVGFSLTKKAIRKGWKKSDLPCIDSLPASKVQQLSMMFKYRVWNRDRSVALATEGLGQNRLQGRSVLLFDQNSRSAAEMVAAFAAEHRLAPIVGTRTPGQVLGAVNFSLPHGCNLRMPIATWSTWGGETIEGSGVEPTMEVQLSPDSLAEGVDLQIERACEVAQSL